jgi:hypothetical protein
MTIKTNREVAENFELWGEYFDTEATMSEDDFNAMTVEEREAMIEAEYGTDEQQREQRGE